MPALEHITMTITEPRILPHVNRGITSILASANIMDLPPKVPSYSPRFIWSLSTWNKVYKLFKQRLSETGYFYWAVTVGSRLSPSNSSWALPGPALVKLPLLSEASHQSADSQYHCSHCCTWTQPPAPCLPAAQTLYSFSKSCDTFGIPGLTGALSTPIVPDCGPYLS